MRSNFFRRKIYFIHIIYFKIISTFYSSITYYYQGKYCFYPKLHHKMQKNASQFLKKKTCLQGAKASPCSTYLLRSEIQMIIRTLVSWSDVLNGFSKWTNILQSKPPLSSCFLILSVRWISDDLQIGDHTETNAGDYT